MEFSDEEIYNILDLLEDDVLSLTEVAEEVGENPMYLSGFLHGLHMIGVLEKKVKGSTHIYRVQDRALLDELL